MGLESMNGGCDAPVFYNSWLIEAYRRSTRSILNLAMFSNGLMSSITDRMLFTQFLLCNARSCCSLFW
jgi:hypothetical protein